MKKEFTVLQGEKDEVLRLLSKPDIIIGDISMGFALSGQMDPLQAYWKKLGWKYGFNPDTVEPSNSELTLLAEPI